MRLRALFEDASKVDACGNAFAATFEADCKSLKKPEDFIGATGFDLEATLLDFASAEMPSPFDRLAEAAIPPAGCWAFIDAILEFLLSRSFGIGTRS